MTKKQKELERKHGTPEKFSLACFRTVPGFISVDEAFASIKKYKMEWNKAGLIKV
jgi:hypothetical protein